MPLLLMRLVSMRLVSMPLVSMRLLSMRHGGGRTLDHPREVRRMRLGGNCRQWSSRLPRTRPAAGCAGAETGARFQVVRARRRQVAMA